MSDSIPCPHCGKQLPSSATTCDQCGASTAAARAKQKPKMDTANAVGLATIVIAVGTFIYLFGSGSSGAAKPALTDAQCQKDLMCWSGRQGLAAERACQDAVERLAKHTFRWVDSEVKFPSVAWGDPEHTKLRYFGDAIEFQNGFGAYTRHTYGCTWEPSKQLATAEAFPGRLPQQ